MFKQKIVVGQSGITAGQMQDFWRMVGDGTLDGKTLAYILANISKIRQEALGANVVTTARARAIMGRNFFGSAEAEKYFGLKPTEEDLRTLSVIPFSEETLRQCRDAHILVAVLSISILGIRAKVDCKLFYQHEDAWYNNEQFAKEQGIASWHLVRKDIVSNSTSKNWKKQIALLGKDEEVPSARVMVYTIIGHYLANGERIFQSIYTRCQDISSDGFRVRVGSFDQRGLGVSNDWGGSRRDDIGLASSRKIQSH